MSTERASKSGGTRNGRRWRRIRKKGECREKGEDEKNGEVLVGAGGVVKEV